MGIEDRSFLSLLNPFGRNAAARTAGNLSTARPDDRRVFLVVIENGEAGEAALRFAARRARNTGGRVALFTADEGPEFQHWMFVGSLMQEESRAEAEESLHRHAATVHALSGEHPEIMVGEGSLCDALFTLIDQDPGISVVVLGTPADDAPPSDLISALTWKHAGRLRVPVTIVPANLRPEEIDGLT